MSEWYNIDFAPQGWQCPICKRVYSPSTPMCYYCGNGVPYTYSSTTVDDALLKEQEAKIGHWIDSAGNDKCSVCGATYSDLYPDYQYTHYCPNCGAKMIVQEVKWDG